MSKSRKTAKICLISVVLLSLMFIGVVSALVVVPEGGRALVYNNGSYVILPEGTYTSVERIDNVWYVNGIPFGEDLIEPSPTAAPSPIGNAPVSLTEIILLIIWVIFLIVAFASGEPFAYGISAFVSILLGIDLALIYLGDSGEWIFGIIGFAIMMFGIFQMLIAMTIKGKKRSGQR